MITLNSRYSREQALEDGLLIDVSDIAENVGFLFPTAISAGLWAHPFVNRNRENVREVIKASVCTDDFKRMDPGEFRLHTWCVGWPYCLTLRIVIEQCEKVGTAVSLLFNEERLSPELPSTSGGSLYVM